MGSPSSDASGAVRPRGTLGQLSLSLLRVCAVTGVLLLVYAAAPLDRSHTLGLAARLLLWLTVVCLTALWEIRAILRSHTPWLQAAESAAISVPLLLLPFAAAYAAMSASDAASFTEPLGRVDAVYFAVTVFATVGFGDVAPVSDLARMLVTAQMLADLLLIGVIVRVLVGAAQQRREVLNAGVPVSSLRDEAGTKEPHEDGAPQPRSERES